MYLHALATEVPPTTFTQLECWDLAQRSGARTRLNRRSMLILHSILRSDHGIARRHFAVADLDRVFDLNFNCREGDRKVTYGDIFLQAEKEYSRHNFEYADVEMLFERFRMAEAACRKYLDDGWVEDDNNVRRNLMAQPAYDQCIKASHVFNLLDARGVISVTERQSYILRVRELAKACGEAWLATEAGGAT